MKMKRWATCVAIICAMVNVHASTFTWDGGASTLNFGDASNWDPNGTTFTTADEYQMTDGSSINAGTNFSVGGFDISGGSQLSITSGTTFDVNANNVSSLDDGTLTVDGTLDFGANRWNTGGIGGTMNIVVNGTLQGRGNFYSGNQMNMNIEVNGTFDHRLTSFGTTLNQSRSQVLRVNSGGVYDVYYELTLRSDSTAETAVYLNGGTMNFGSTLGGGADDYNYSSLVMNGDDGIIFTDAASHLVLTGNRTNDVNTWITDGALSSQVGAIHVNYDSGQDETVVTADPVVEGPFYWDGGASTLNFGDAANWNPDGTGFTTADRYLIEDGSSVTAGSSFSIAGFDLRGSSSLLIDTGMTMTINGNLQTLLDDGTLTVDGTINFGGNRWDASGVGTHTIINVNGVWTSSGNFYGGAQKSVAINVNGSFTQRLTSFGATVNTATEVRSNVVTVSSSGTYTASGGLVLGGTEKNVTAVHLNGGTMEVPSGAAYNYSNLILSGDDGIIFKDAASEIVLAGNRTNDVNTWVSDGALFSEAGSMQVSYDSGNDETIVSIYTPPSSIGNILIDILPNGTNYSLQWNSENGASYAVESTTDLVFGIWSDIFTNLTGNNSLMSVTGTVNEAQEYFRIYLEE